MADTGAGALEWAPAKAEINPPRADNTNAYIATRCVIAEVDHCANSRSQQAADEVALTLCVKKIQPNVVIMPAVMVCSPKTSNLNCTLMAETIPAKASRKWGQFDVFGSLSEGMIGNWISFEVRETGSCLICSCGLRQITRRPRRRPSLRCDKHFGGHAVRPARASFNRPASTSARNSSSVNSIEYRYMQLSA